MSNSPYTPRQQAFIAALSIPFVENTCTDIFNPSIPLVEQGHLVPDWVNMGIVTQEETENNAKQALILKGVDACVAAFESASPGNKETAVLDALHAWAENDLKDPKFTIDSKYHDITYTLRKACRETVPVTLALKAHTDGEWLGSGIMVIDDLETMVSDIQRALPVIKENNFQSAELGMRGYSIETYPDEEVSLYGESLHVSEYGSYIENKFKHSDEWYQSPYMSLDDLEMIVEYARNNDIAFIDATDNFDDFVLKIKSKNDPLSQLDQSNEPEMRQ